MKSLIKPKHLEKGDTIGIIAPSMELKPEYIEKSIKNLHSLGFKMKLSDNLFSDSFGYAGS
ncbi:MAG: LD-carboxypeptidase, partial [Oscillospiraceae bacterium]